MFLFYFARIKMRGNFFFLFNRMRYNSELIVSFLNGDVRYILLSLGLSVIVKLSRERLYWGQAFTVFFLQFDQYIMRNKCSPTD